MTDIQEKMQALIRREELDRAFDARFPKEMQVKLRSAKVAIAGEILQRPCGSSRTWGTGI